MRTGSWVENKYGCDCGADDCPTCHPELQDTTQCECCGEEFHLYDLSDEGLCTNCYLNATKCDACDSWTFNFIEIEDICLCENCAEMVVKEWLGKN